jgi:tripeptidyl-peptidase I
MLTKHVVRSASCLVFAAIISNLNSIRLSQHKPPMGFLNPWIYSKGFQGLTDIVDGCSIGCFGVGLQDGDLPGGGWDATKGWDPVTGYRTPNLRRWLNWLAVL